MSISVIFFYAIFLEANLKRDYSESLRCLDFILSKDVYEGVCFLDFCKFNARALSNNDKVTKSTVTELFILFSVLPFVKNIDIETTKTKIIEFVQDPIDSLILNPFQKQFYDLLITSPSEPKKYYLKMLSQLMNMYTDYQDQVELSQIIIFVIGSISKYLETDPSLQDCIKLLWSYCETDLHFSLCFIEGNNHIHFDKETYLAAKVRDCDREKVCNYIVSRFASIGDLIGATDIIASMESRDIPLSGSAYLHITDLYLF
eukprot:TRINITY_DN5781_c0_g2_i2.p1 TRINITY_DN5781_c0_g2~~TRINITY_DN5781_c0_g2_i2.p1  ORF type:complete len:259 (-),score=40.13 TRINITY_DN5781_c0_g2_i2:385-1161(-)